MTDTQFWLMDGRANFSIDDAIVCDIRDTLKEAMQHINDYGNDTCIVEVTEGSQELVYSLLWLTCPDCDSTTIDHIGGDNYRCECGLHFAASREEK